MSPLMTTLSDGVFAIWSSSLRFWLAGTLSKWRSLSQRVVMDCVEELRAVVFMPVGNGFAPFTPIRWISRQMYRWARRNNLLKCLKRACTKRPTPPYQG